MNDHWKSYCMAFVRMLYLTPIFLLAAFLEYLPLGVWEYVLTLLLAMAVLIFISLSILRPGKTRIKIAILLITFSAGFFLSSRLEQKFFIFSSIELKIKQKQFEQDSQEGAERWNSISNKSYRVISFLKENGKIENLMNTSSDLNCPLHSKNMGNGFYIQISQICE